MSGSDRAGPKEFGQICFKCPGIRQLGTAAFRSEILGLKHSSHYESSAKQKEPLVQGGSLMIFIQDPSTESGPMLWLSGLTNLEDRFMPTCCFSNGFASPDRRDKCAFAIRS